MIIYDIIIIIYNIIYCIIGINVPIQFLVAPEKKNFFFSLPNPSRLGYYPASRGWYMGLRQGPVLPNLIG